MSPSIDSLLRKYDVPVPRYTSYPAVPFWKSDDFDAGAWADVVHRTFNETNERKGISLYLHLPFCESLCTYCACNTRITRNRGVEGTYINALLKEWELYREIFGAKPIIRELHLGGGTPTFFSAANLEKLLRSLLRDATVHQEHAFSFEGHPNNTTEEHLRALFNAGFRRVSYGVQDLDERVQKAIHRIQPFEHVERATRQSREIGYTSVSFDLIYGLPYQTLDSVARTIASVISLRPDRIAYYSYAHVPWVRPGQRGYEDADLPSDVAKRALYEQGREMLRKAGYLDIGMDHFALPGDALALAQASGDLHRNFMGYTTTQTDLLIGLGASAISDAYYGYAQNAKKVEDYSSRVEEGDLAVWKGHRQSDEDLRIRQCILDIACQGKVAGDLLASVSREETRNRLREMEMDGLIILSSDGLLVTETGRPFVRNICSVFDANIGVRERARNDLFSKAV